jgi:guanylate kinase
MLSLLVEKHFVENALVHGKYYGTSWEAMRQVQQEGKHCLLDIDTQGVERIKKLETVDFQPKYIFIAPPSIEVLEQRLVGRGSESEETLRRRIGNAKAEVDYGLTQGNFDSIVYNDDLDQAVDDFNKAVRNLYNL